MQNLSLFDDLEQVDKTFEEAVMSPRLDVVRMDFIEAKSLHAEANIFIAAEIPIIAIDVFIDIPPPFTNFENATISARRTPTPTSPLAKPFQSKYDKSSHAEANILIATAIITI